MLLNNKLLIPGIDYQIPSIRPFDLDEMTHLFCWCPADHQHLLVVNENDPTQTELRADLEIDVKALRSATRRSQYSRGVFRVQILSITTDQDSQHYLLASSGLTRLGWKSQFVAVESLFEFVKEASPFEPIPEEQELDIRNGLEICLNYSIADWKAKNLKKLQEKVDSVREEGERNVLEIQEDLRMNRQQMSDLRRVSHSSKIKNDETFLQHAERIDWPRLLEKQARLRAELLNAEWQSNRAQTKVGMNGAINAERTVTSLFTIRVH